jgi:hypothetical protein
LLPIEGTQFAIASQVEHEQPENQWLRVEGKEFVIA